MHSVPDPPSTVTATSDDARSRAELMLRPLSRRYLLVLVCVAGLVTLDQAILQPLLVQLNFSAPAINLAGRQRMLSQKICKEALAGQLTSDPVQRAVHHRQLETALAQWSTAHDALRHGDRSRGIRVATGDVAAALDVVEPSFIAMQAAANELLAEDEASTVEVNHDTANRILQLEPEYLQGMERVVSMLESSAKARVAWLRVCGFVAMLVVLLLLIAVYWFVLRPAARMIRHQVEQLADSDLRHQQMAEMLRQARDHLELRVQQRTHELTTANAALAQEMAQRQATEQRARGLSTQLAHASRVNALGQLATGLAHEINQPLATVTNYAGVLELALRQAAAPEAGTWRELVAQIQQAALRAGGIVRGMRSFVRREEASLAPHELNRLIEEVLELCGPELRSAGIQLTFAPSTTSYVLVDAVQIQQVLVNLVQNAAQAIMAANSQERKVWIETEDATGEVIVTVKDTGPGLPADLSDYCFEPFQSSKHEGLGLGLAISKTLIEQHQGRIWSEQRDSCGAVIRFSLPRYIADDRHAEQ